jgi:hypothetical protein
MESIFKIWETSRNIYLKFLENYSLEQVNKIPDGFSNNFIWNAGHVIVSQQKLIYTLSGLPVSISDEMIEKYQNGSRPDGKTTQEEVDEIKKLLLSTVAKTRTDFANGLFQNFTEYQSKTGFHLGTFNDSLEFNNYHEGIHLGMIMNIKKFV